MKKRTAALLATVALAGTGVFLGVQSAQAEQPAGQAIWYWCPAPPSGDQAPGQTICKG